MNSCDRANPHIFRPFDLLLYLLAFLFSVSSYIHVPSCSTDMPTAVNVLRPAPRAQLATPNVFDAESLENGLSGFGDHVPPNITPSLEKIKEARHYFMMVTTGLPREDMYDTPIHLRNAPIFYLGHIPAVWELRLSEALGYELVDPDKANRFKRGKDAKVDDPDVVPHSHSKEPDEGWGSFEEVFGYGQRVRACVDTHYHEWVSQEPWKARQGLWEAFEHEC